MTKQIQKSGKTAQENSHIPEKIILSAGQPSTKQPNKINIPMLRHHSTDGIPQWGYAGSGPADTAMSILHLFLPVQTPYHTLEEFHASIGISKDSEKYEEYLENLSYEEQEREDDRYHREYKQWEVNKPIKLWDGNYVSPETWALHQLFKFEYLSKLSNSKSHVLEISEIQQWIDKEVNKLKK